MENQSLKSYERVEKANRDTLWMALEETERQIEDARQLQEMCCRYPLKEREKDECLGKLEGAVGRMLLDAQNQIFAIAQIMKKAEENGNT